MSFRKYGGMNYAATHNIVKSNINTTDSFYVTNNVGQANSYINFNSDISGNVLIFGDLDLSGNLNISGDIDCSGNLTVDGKSNFYDDVDISANLNVSGGIDCSGNLVVSGNITAEYMFLSSGTTYTNDPNGVVPKSYIDAIASGVRPLAACQCAAVTTLITLNLPPPDTIEGYTLQTGNRVLLNYQSTTNASVDNGIYVATITSPGSGSWARATDMAATDDSAGAYTYIQFGNNQSKSFIQLESPAIVGTDPLLFGEFSSTIKIGQGLDYNPLTYTVSVDACLNFITYLDNSGNTLNIGAYTNTLNIGNTSTISNIDGSLNVLGYSRFNQNVYMSNNLDVLGNVGIKKDNLL